jgi:putative nucleotidyltransferase with HDIG domain
MERLLKLARFLRDPEKGCPWDREQTFASFKECLVKEATEVSQAIEKEDFANLKEELGDTLFNLVFLINLAEERGLFTKDAVVEAAYHKILSRHPHVFGGEKAKSAQEALDSFTKAKEENKAREKTPQRPAAVLSPTREDAWKLLCEYTENESLRKHALAVEAAMAAMSHKFHEPEEKWRIVGLLHDLDYEKFPDKHPMTAVFILKQHGYSEDIQRAILCHVEERTGFVPRSPLEKSLCAVDELCGFLVAVALVRPSKKLEDVAVESVLKKMKDKAFARSVDRQAILHGAALLEIPLEDHIRFVLENLKPVAAEFGV